jgi:pyrroline-5-carboxylate reductase
MRFLFLGCGKMGSAIVQALIDHAKIPEHQISILKKNQTKIHPNLKKYRKINYLKPSDKIAAPEIVFICIKPQNFEKIFREFLNRGLSSGTLNKNTIFISILAGKKIESFEKIYPQIKIIRTMPNLAVASGDGIFAYLSGKNINTKETKTLSPIFSHFGLCFQVKNENEFDAITALFGSGPAYIFLMQKIFLKLAKAHGIAPRTASDLVKKLFLGSAKFAQNSHLTFDELVNEVASKGGTTEAALKVFQKQGLGKIVRDAVKAAHKRSQELSR